MLYTEQTLTPQFIGDAHQLVRSYYHTTEAHTDIPQYDFDWHRYEVVDIAGMLLCTAVYNSDELVGFTLYVVTNHPHHKHVMMAECDTIAVDPTYRGQGIGRTLYNYTEGILRSRDVKFVTNRYRLCYGVKPMFEDLGFRVIEHVYMKEL